MALTAPIATFLTDVDDPSASAFTGGNANAFPKAKYVWRQKTAMNIHEQIVGELPVPQSEIVTNAILTIPQPF